MKLPLSWLKELVPVTAAPAQIADALTSLGLEVEGIEQVSIPDGIVVGKVLTREKHPDSDHLSCCTVDAGTGEILPIVCGAPNVAAGQTVAVATIGTQIAPDFVIKKAKLRGQPSMGMLCSESELGLSKNHDGIMVLPDTWAIGSPLSSFFSTDAIFEVSLTPNRGDCQSILGLAREVAAYYKLPLTIPAKTPAASGPSLTNAISVEIADADRCPRYMGRLVRGVTIAESPDWLKEKLLAMGLRPINNVVDITNYILMLFGQPMHAFDYATIAGKKIVVCRAAAGSTFVTLDERSHTLTADDLLICDGEKPVALAGIMGGANSGIADTTKDVFLECAYFNPTGVRKTARRLGISTDSSYRFERGVDPQKGLELALDTAAALVAELAGGTVAAGLIDICPAPLASKSITMRQSYCNRLLGITVPKEFIIASLPPINITLTKEDDDLLTFSVPLYRHDIDIEVDLVEEVGRMFGYDNIPTPEYFPIAADRSAYNPEAVIERLRHTLAALGFCEAISNPITSEKKCATLTPSTAPVGLANPLNPELTVMRTTLAAGLLEAVAGNLNRRNSDILLFEIGRVFEKSNETLPRERTKLAIIMEKNWRGTAWNGPATGADFYTLKGIVESLADALGHAKVGATRIDASVPPMFTEAAGIVSSPLFSGYIGEIKPEILKAFEIKSSVVYAELDISDIFVKAPAKPRFAAVPKFQAMDRDFCFIMPETVLAADVCTTIRGVSPLIGGVKPFDVYAGDKLPAGRKSIAFATSISSDEKTLTDDDANAISAKIIATVTQAFGAELRQ